MSDGGRAYVDSSSQECHVAHGELTVCCQSVSAMSELGERWPPPWPFCARCQEWLDKRRRELLEGIE